MVFLTSWCLIFLCVVVVLFRYSPLSWRKYLILAASLLFYVHFAGLAGVLPILSLGTIAYLAALALYRWKTTLPLWVAGMMSVLSLIYYKYTGLLYNLADLPVETLPIAPLAISFFTFELVHYLVEIKR